MQGKQDPNNHGFTKNPKDRRQHLFVGKGCTYPPNKRSKSNKPFYFSEKDAKRRRY
jgi:hypothetical protein